MQIEAVLTKGDLSKTINDFCPLKIALGEDGAVLLSEPRDTELVPGVGVRTRVTAEIHWPVLGVRIPVTVRSAILEVRPVISEEPDGGKLAFRLALREVDISIFPAIVDRGIVNLVNKELEGRHAELSWDFIRTLSHVFTLPDAVASACAIDLRAGYGQVTIGSEAIVFAVSFHAAIQTRTVEPRHPPPHRAPQPPDASRP
jgi:hypothetical protein